MSFTGTKGMPMAPAMSIMGSERLVYSSTSIVCGYALLDRAAVAARQAVEPERDEG